MEDVKMLKMWRAIAIVGASGCFVLLLVLIFIAYGFETSLEVSEQKFSELSFKPPTPMEEFEDWMAEVKTETVPSLAIIDAELALKCAKENNLGENAIKRAQEAIFIVSFEDCKNDETPHLDGFQCRRALNTAQDILKDQSKAKEVKKVVLAYYLGQCLNQASEYRDLRCEDAVKLAEEIGENAVEAQRQLFEITINECIGTTNEKFPIFAPCHKAVKIADKYQFVEAGKNRAEDVLVTQLEHACRKPNGFSCVAALKFAADKNIDDFLLWKASYSYQLDLCRQKKDMYHCGKAVTIGHQRVGSQERETARSLYMQYCLADKENYGENLCNKFADYEEIRTADALLL